MFVIFSKHVKTLVSVEEHRGVISFSSAFLRVLGILSNVNNLRETTEYAKHTESVTRCAGLGDDSIMFKFWLLNTVVERVSCEKPRD